MARRPARPEIPLDSPRAASSPRPHSEPGVIAVSRLHVFAMTNVVGCRCGDALFF